MKLIPVVLFIQSLLWSKWAGYSSEIELHSDRPWTFLHHALQPRSLGLHSIIQTAQCLRYLLLCVCISIPILALCTASQYYWDCLLLTSYFTICHCLAYCRWLYGNVCEQEKSKLIDANHNIRQINNICRPYNADLYRVVQFYLLHHFQHNLIQQSVYAIQSHHYKWRSTADNVQSAIDAEWAGQNLVNTRNFLPRIMRK